MRKKQKISLLHITAQYVAEAQAGRQPRLSDYLVRYPCYVDAIADFVAYYHTLEEMIPSDAEQALVACTQQDQLAKECTSAGIMTTLLITATGQRLTTLQIALRLDVSADIVLLLEQRAIVAASIPSVLCQQIATLLQQPIEMVREYLASLDHCQPGSVIEKSKKRVQVAERCADYAMPHVVDKPSFRRVVETSSLLSAQQKARWCTLLDAEGV